MALIQCLLGSATPVLSSTTYAFERDDHGRFVCEVHDLVHIQCLLSRDDIYRIAAAVVPEPVESHIETLLGSSILPSLVEIADGVSVQIGAVVARAHTESGLTIAEWNAQAADDREAALELTVEAMKAEHAPKPQDPAQPEPEPAPASEPDAAQPDASEAVDPAEEDTDGDQDGPTLDAVVAGIVTEADVAPAPKPRRGRRSR
jgi:hypothetical protein